MDRHSTYASGSSARTKLLLRDNVYKPNTRQLVRTIADALLTPHDDANSLHDVRLTSADGHQLPANKTMLAIGSPVFRRMFFSDFAEHAAASVPLSFSTRVLRNVLQFIYTAECDLINQILRRLPSATASSASSASSSSSASTASTPRRDFPRSDLHALVDLAVAADYLALATLQRLANETVLAIARTYHHLACLVLDAVVTHRPAFRYCAPACLCADLLQDPGRYFQLPDVRAAVPPPPGARIGTAVLDLSAAALRLLLRTASGRAFDDEDEDGGGDGDGDGNHDSGNNNSSTDGRGHSQTDASTEGRSSATNSARAGSFDPRNRIYDNGVDPQARSADERDSCYDSHSCLQCDSDSDSDSDACDGVTTAYLFQVVYFWATKGQLIERRAPQSTDFDPRLRATGAVTATTAGLVVPQPRARAAPAGDVAYGSNGGPVAAGREGASSRGGGNNTDGTSSTRQVGVEDDEQNNGSNGKASASSSVRTSGGGGSGGEATAAVIAAGEASTAGPAGASSSNSSGDITIARAQEDAAAAAATVRWKVGVELVCLLELQDVEPGFVADYVENSGLIDAATLFGLYRFMATGRGTAAAEGTQGHHGNAHGSGNMYARNSHTHGPDIAFGHAHGYGAYGARGDPRHDHIYQMFRGSGLPRLPGGWYSAAMLKRDRALFEY